MKIAYGNSRMDKKWKNTDISWEDFCSRVKTTQRTTETVEEYRKMRKGGQDSIKDVGGFVGGHLKDGRRKKGNDGNMWKSVENSKGICRWQKLRK